MRVEMEQVDNREWFGERERREGNSMGEYDKNPLCPCMKNS